jgi:hypothetical protein
VSLPSDTEATWLLNASTTPQISLTTSQWHGAYSVAVQDKFGHLISEAMVTFPVSELTVEVGGSIAIRRVDEGQIRGSKR